MKSKKKFLNSLLSKGNNSKYKIITNHNHCRKLISKYAIYIKFVNNKFLKSFIYKGEFHFQNIKYFRDKGRTDKIIGDPNESVKKSTFNRGLMSISFGPKTLNIPLKLSNHRSVTLRQQLNNNSAIFCLIRLTKNDLYEFKPGFFKIKRNVVNSLFNSFSSYNRTPVLIKNMNAVSLRIHALLKHNHKTMCALYDGPVHYSRNQALALNDIYKDIPNKELSQEVKDKAVAFTKSLTYYYQREYRFLLSNSSMLDSYGNLNLGNINRFVMTLNRKELLDLTLILREPKDEQTIIKMFSRMYKLNENHPDYTYEILNNIRPCIINKGIFDEVN